MQCNYGSMDNMEKKSTNNSKKLYENNMVHFLGTDVHKQNTIYERIPEILPQISEIIGEEKTRRNNNSKCTESIRKQKNRYRRTKKQIKLSLKEKK